MTTMAIKGNQSKPVQRHRFIDYFFVISIMALTGFEYFYRSEILIAPLFLISVIYFLNKRQRFNSKVFLAFIPFVLLSMLHTVLGYDRNVLSSIFLLLSFLVYFFIASILKEKFFEVFIISVFVICLISLCCFLLTYSNSFMDSVVDKIAPYFKPLGSDNVLETGKTLKMPRNIIIYNFREYTLFFNRNSGPFWEPGMFTIFINVALFINLMMHKKFVTFKNIIFIITNITTFSTTGYIAFIFILFIYALFISKSKLNLLYVIALAAISLVVSNLDFMESKIMKDYADTNGPSRFQAAVIHYQIISEHPFTGVGDGTSEFVSRLTDVDSTANGLTLVFAKFGLFVGLLYYLLLFRASSNIMSYFTANKIAKHSFFILLLVLAFSQDITIRHFYLFLITFGIANVVKHKPSNHRLRSLQFAYHAG